jgi:hypothetical protein
VLSFGTPPDNVTGLNYLESAVDAEVPEAHTQLGLMFLHGWNVPMDVTKAVR